MQETKKSNTLQTEMHVQKKGSNLNKYYKFTCFWFDREIAKSLKATRVSHYLHVQIIVLRSQSNSTHIGICTCSGKKKR